MSLISSMCTSVVKFTIAIENITEITSSGVRSPPFTLQHLPWYVCVKKHTDTQHPDKSSSLALFLYCSHENGSHWSCAAKTKFKIFSHNANKPAFERDIGMRKFSPKNYISWGFNKFILWNELFDTNKEFVFNDKISVEFEIVTEAPKYAFWKRIEPINININNVVTSKKNCFVNSLLQILYFCSYSVELNKEDTVANALTRFENIFNGRTEYMKEFFDGFGWVTDDPLKQNILSFAKSFFETIKTELVDDKAAVMFWSAFEGRQCTYQLLANGKRRIDDSKQFYGIRLEQESGKIVV